MKKIIIFVITFLISFNVYAIDIPACTDSEMTRLKELANNVEFKRNINITEQELDEDTTELYVTYDITIANFDKDLKISYKNNVMGENTITSETTTIKGLNEDNTITFSIYAYTNNLCTNNLLKTVTVKLPTYNSYYYYNKDKCQTYPNFKYCKEYLDLGDLYYEDIDDMFDEYIKERTSVPVQDNKLANNIVYLIGGGVIILLAIIITIIIIKKKKNKDDL